MSAHYLLLFLSCFLVLSCAPSSTSSVGSGEYQKPLCQGTANLSDLEAKKERLFRIIQNSDKYGSADLREKAILNYKSRIKIRQESACPQDAERMIDNIIRLHEK